MKGFLGTLAFVLIGSVLWAHVPKPRRFFDVYLHAKLHKEKEACKVTFEKRFDETDSQVVLLHGAQQFNQLVTLMSHQHPVVVKFFSPQSIASLQVKIPYQNVADFFNKEVFFVAADVAENYELFAQLLQQLSLQHIDLPLFLFYKDGSLYVPAHEPAPMVQGYLSEENLKNFIKNKFFGENHSLDVSV